MGILLLSVLVACSGSGGSDADGDAAPATVRAPAREIPNPSAPGSMGSTLTVGDDGNLYLSWIEPEGEGHRLCLAAWVGDEWSGAQTVARGTNWFVNWADFPSVAVLADGTVAAHWLEMRGEGTYAYGVRVSVSTDRGASWTDPAWAHTDDTPTEHGFVSLVPWGTDGFRVVWLDGRDSASGHEGHDGHDDHGGAGAMALRTGFLDREGTVHGETLIDDRVCDCCGTAAVEHEDVLVTVYRDRSPEEVRDISFSREVPHGWSPPAPVHEDGWKILGCPVNGPALAVSGDELACAWFTMPEGSDGEVRFARFEGGGFGQPVRLDGGAPLGRVDLAAHPAGGFLAVWVETAADSAEVRWRRVVDGRAEPSAVAAVTSASRASGFPRVAVHRGKLFLTRTETGEPGRVVTGVIELD